jgi:tetratricopeptide (TPR) repeat protein
MSMSHPRRRIRRAPIRTIGLRIRKLRRAKGMNQFTLIGPEFTKRYLRAVERCNLIPSLPVIELFANRLDVPVANLLRANIANHSGAGPVTEKEIGVLQEDLNYQFVYAKMLIKEGKLMEAHESLQRTENYIASIGALAQKIPPTLLFRLPCLKGTAHLQAFNPAPALPELEKALAMVEADEEKAAIVRNYLGVAYYLQERPSLAIKEHLLCLRAVQSDVVKDLSYRFSIYRNLANDYWTLGDAKQALAFYKLALPLLNDLNDPSRKAAIFSGMGIAYWELGDKVSAILWNNRAKELYAELGDRNMVAEIALAMAEYLVLEHRYADAEVFLKEASSQLLDPAGESSDLLLCAMYKIMGMSALAQGKLTDAEEYAELGMKYGYKAATDTAAACAVIAELPESADRKIRPGSACYPVKAYAEVLHLAARIAESQAQYAAADARYSEALEWVQKTGSHEVFHVISLSYAETMEKRGSHGDAMAYYKAAAQANLASSRRRSGQTTLVG